MIHVFKLTKRHVDTNKDMPKVLKDIKLFSTCVGHGVGTIDFSQKVLEISDDEYEMMIKHSNDYVKFKIGNLSKYFEIEIFPEHAAKLLPGLCECKLKDALLNFHEGYLVLRKDF
ncbi:formate hydrogenlyase maturation HycH family protein [Campylobacter geochelonis]|uniref:Formate hydrogenlyase maturation protein HycH n=1 Tax=Campylobacter geochelonis TaxID=1780362 RepID=A0A128EHM5_9BACT|nr:formate hydrogenlyase maturation HycH family protein [Campylobacter geochelonis]QKF71926.1 formate hydrogenlyase family maturation protein [Campylobacter geochelonis]CZE47862.1 formate hydrogenlyase maturation protein HycH [Campylobacter geochelonis]